MGLFKNNRVRDVLAVIGALAVIVLLIQSVSNQVGAEVLKSEDEQGGQSQQLAQDTVRTLEGYTIRAFKVPEKMDFAGEPVPLEDADVYKRMDRELLVNGYWQSNGLLMFKRAREFFPVIEPILAEMGIPDDFKYLAIAESNLLNAVSPAGAKGVWQFMPATGKELGLEVNANVDERYNLKKSTRAAGAYLLKRKRELGSWTLAAASYNAGKTGITRQLKRQEVGDYYDLLLNPETSRYIFRILAIKEVMEHPQKYGFVFNEDDLYQPIPTYSVEVDTAITDMPAFARQYGINYRTLKIHNPWLREAHLNNKSRKLYTIDIPEKGYYR